MILHEKKRAIMTISAPTIALAAGGPLACATAAAAQWVVGDSRDACFYRDSGYRGPYFCIGGNDQLDTLPRGRQPELLSVRESAGRNVRVFKDSRFGGDSASLRSHVCYSTTGMSTISSVPGPPHRRRAGGPRTRECGPGHSPRRSGHPAAGARSGRTAHLPDPGRSTTAGRNRTCVRRCGRARNIVS